ncbi:uncharacterized protein LOC133289600 isoform X2 [Gastrolobium bilobum]|uniref:uncharacterized protein LOC133289600 isoform X2 n=1 Tax=Gastrolobium bilobum TaxID=150636 RepID=UPI002AB1D014|nr:uncharacterized protein LOC133289600 isoform X2 [Gastrolobium bilobum]
MDKSRKQAMGSSSSTMNFDHLFGPKDSSSTSSSTTSIFGSIFSPSSSAVGGRDSRTQDVGNKKFGAPGIHRNKGENSSANYQNETVEPIYFSSSIYYGGQENYSPRSRTTEPHHVLKKDKDNDEPTGNDSNSATRGNWWEGSLYY